MTLEEFRANFADEIELGVTFGGVENLKVEYVSEYAGSEGVEILEEKTLHHYELYDLLKALDIVDFVDTVDVDFVQRVGANDSVTYFIRDCVNNEIYEKNVKRISAEYYKAKEAVR